MWPSRKKGYGRAHFVSLCVVIVVGASLFTSGCNRARPSVTAISDNHEWHDFEGTWTAAGDRSIMSLGPARHASIGNFDGSLLLTGSGRPALGFRAQALVLNDTGTGLVGRAVWTDEHGDQLYSELRGEGTASGNRIAGTFVGGSGRYAGAEGAYEFSWRFVLENEDGVVQGQSSGLKGRVRVGQSAQKASLEAHPRD